MAPLPITGPAPDHVGGVFGSLTIAEVKALLGIPAGSFASEAYVDTQVQSLIDAAPGALDSLNELSAALGDDPNFASSITTQIAGRAGKYAADIGDGVASTITVTHGLGTQDVTLSLRPVAGGAAVIAQWEPVSNTAVELRFETAPSAGQYRVVIVG